MSERDARGTYPPRFLWQVLAALVVFLVAGAAVTAAAADRGQAAEEDWAPVTVLYMTDVKGKIEPCG